MEQFAAATCPTREKRKIRSIDSSWAFRMNPYAASQIAARRRREWNLPITMSVKSNGRMA